MVANFSSLQMILTLTANLILFISSLTGLPYSQAELVDGSVKVVDYWKERTIYTFMSTVATDLVRYASADVQQKFATCLRYCKRKHFLSNHQEILLFQLLTFRRSFSIVLRSNPF